MAVSSVVAGRWSYALIAASVALFGSLPGAALAQNTLRFESEALDVDTGAVLTGRPSAFDNHDEADVAIAYDADASPHAVVIQNAGVLLARLPQRAFASVSDTDIASLPFTSELDPGPFSSTTTIVVKSNRGAYYKLGNPVESSTSVTFDVVLLRAAPSSGGSMFEPWTFLPGGPSPLLAFAACALAFLLWFRPRRAFGVAFLSRAPATAAIVALCVAGLALAQSGYLRTETQKLMPVPNDLASADGYGQAVAAWNDTVVVTAPAATAGALANGGAAYVLVRNGAGWTQQAKLITPDPATTFFFGASAAIDGNTVVVGDSFNNGKGTQSGAAYVFVRSGTTWSFQAKLLASDGDVADNLGAAVAISGNTIVAGAYSDESGALSGTGSAYVFVRSGTTWTQQAKLTAPVPVASALFGIGVGVSGDLAAIGTRDSALGRGAVYTFTRSAGVWTQQAKVSAADAADFDTFGDRLALQGTRLLVGAAGKDDLGTNAGSGYVFELSAGAWVQRAKLLPSAGMAFELAGNSVALDGDAATLGAGGADNNTKVDDGAAYLFLRQSNGSWSNVAKLIASDATDRAGLSGGNAIASGSVVLGARGNSRCPQSGPCPPPTGSAYDYVYGSTDTVPPVVPKPPDIFAEAQSVAGAIVTFTVAASDDVDGPLVASCVPPSGSTFPFGYTTVTCTATDAAGNSGSNTFVVLVDDTTDPNAVCSNVVLECTGPQTPVTTSCTATDAVDTNPTVSSNALASYPVGFALYQCVANDDGFNFDVEECSVQVVDTVPPTCVPPPTGYVACTQPGGVSRGQAFVAQHIGQTQVSDLCGGGGTAIGGPLFLPSGCQLGTTSTITFDVRDGAHNHTSCSTDVVVYDAEPPLMTAPAPVALQCNAAGGVSASDANVTSWLTAAIASDHCFDSTLTNDGPGFYGLGTNTVHFVAQDTCANTATRTSSVTVLDTIAPQTSCSDVALECEGPLTPVTTSCAGTDVCDADVATASSAAPSYALGAHEYTCDTQDDSGNGDSATCQVEVVDTTLPEVLCRDERVECQGPLTPVTTLCVGIDICDPSVTTQSTAAASYALGAHGYTCTATDDASNSANVSCQVQVVDTTAAVLAPIVTTLVPVPIGTSVPFSAHFTDACGVHTGSFTFGDGGSAAATITEASGVGDATSSHVYAVPGVYTVFLALNDGSANIANGMYQYVVVYDPNGGFVTGSGSVDSPAGAYTPAPALTGRASFGFQARYAQGATVPSGQTQFRFREADFSFQSEAYEWLVLAGADAKFKGTGSVNGVSGYRFMLTATDGSRPGGGGTDRFHLKVWNIGSGGVIYDNEPGMPDDAKASYGIANGNIVIHP